MRIGNMLSYMLKLLIIMDRMVEGEMTLTVLEYILMGFVAQLIDGALGMAYGVSLTSFLLTSGLAPSVASASVHTSEVFTTFVSGLSHFKVGNIDKKLFKELVVSGSIFACFGAYLLVNIPTWFMKPIVSLYLGIMGVLILLRSFNRDPPTYKLNRSILAAIGGFLDALGGGGWGPIVASTLIADGEDPAKTIGSVNLAEFFVTICQSLAFLTMLGLRNLHIILGLIIGGVIAAPLGAIACKKIPRRALMLLVSVLLICLSVRGLCRF